MWVAAIDAVPAGGDAYVLSNIINDLGRRQGDRDPAGVPGRDAPFLRAAALRGVLADRPQPDALLKLVDLEMLVTGEGPKQRTRGEFVELLRRAGLRLTGVTPGPVASIVEGVPQGA